jgi:3-deoxy-D-arabino-heptulosonate 7-phosphate (DAHP) synthase
LTENSCDFDGLSITDSCLGWEESEKMIFSLYESL